MAYSNINLGAAPNDHTGDSPRAAGQKVNDNFAQSYARFNVLDTVSETAGVPTGGVIERGSNANGEYVRFADGTQICTMARQVTANFNIAAGAIYRTITAQVTGTYPAAFAIGTDVHQSGQVVSDGNTDANNFDSWLGQDDQMSSSTTYRSALMSATLKTAVTVNVRLTAIGRWN